MKPPIPKKTMGEAKALYNAEQKVKKKISMKDEMAAIVTNFEETKKSREKAKQDKATAESKRCGQRDGKEMINNLPERIKKAAQDGKTCIYESCHPDSEYGHFKLGIVSEWAREQGFEIKWDYNQEPANEGGDPYDFFTISWEE